MKKKRLFLLIMCISFITIQAQVITGKVFDSITSQPIPFAHILLENSQSGSICNSEGVFEINLTENNILTKLIISAIGYKTKQIAISDDEALFLTVLMEKDVYNLDEIVVEYKSPETILKQFHEKYRDNYHQGSSTMEAFYRTTFKENCCYVNLLEATINIREFSGKKGRSFEVEIIHQRKSNDYRVEKWSESGNYLYQTIASNPVLELSDFLNLKNLKYYNISRLDDTSYDDELVYGLSFMPKESAKKPLYTAKVYIKAKDHALIKATYFYSNNDLKIRNLSYNRKQIHTSYTSGSIEYRKVGNWYFPLYISGDTGFEIISKETGDTLAKNILMNEILLSNIKENHDISIDNHVSKHGDVYKKPSVYDPGYWNKQVKIPATKLYQESVNDLSKNQSLEVQFFTNSPDNFQDHQFEATMAGQIDSILTVYHLTGLFNGVAVVTNNNKIVHHQAYGYSDLESKKKLTTSSLFDIGSNTKQFTAAIILMMMEEGRLKLTDRINKYIPNYVNGDKVNIHNLLSHTSGIPTFDYEDYGYNQAWFNNEIETNFFIDTFCSGELMFTPGSKMEYSNSNYLILTSIIEKIAEKGYYDVLKEIIFTPLEMKNSFRPDSLPSENLTIGYVFDNNYIIEPDWKKSNMKGVGCIYSTSEDLLKWITSINENELLSPETTNTMRSPISYYEYYNADFGYSWAINRSTFNTDKSTFFYGGTSLGYYSMLTTIPEKGITIILLNNMGNFPRIELTNEILSLFEN